MCRSKLTGKERGGSLTEEESGYELITLDSSTVNWSSFRVCSNRETFKLEASTCSTLI